MLNNSVGKTDTQITNLRQKAVTVKNELKFSIWKKEVISHVWKQGGLKYHLKAILKDT